MDDSESWFDGEETPSVASGWQGRPPRRPYPQQNFHGDQHTSYNKFSPSTSVVNNANNGYSTKMSFLDSLDKSNDHQSCEKVEAEGLIDWDFLKENEVS